MDFDDVYIAPRVTSIKSRSEVSFKSSFRSLMLDLPIIAAPMKGIVGTSLIIELAKLGGIGILHRFHKSDSVWRIDVNEIANNTDIFGISISLNNDNWSKIDYAIDRGAKIICVDVANGYMQSLAAYTSEINKYLRDKDSGIILMSGNVVCWNGVNHLFENGVDMIRCGIGSGRLCSTTSVTGVGKPQLQAIIDCNGNNYKPQQSLYAYTAEYNKVLESHISTRDSFSLVSDGGITSSSDIVKALAAGADFVMIGSLFANAFESDNDGIVSGMASRRIQEESNREIHGIEGISMSVPKTMYLKDMVDQWAWGIASACSYVDARNLDQLRKNSQFISAR